MTLRYGPDYVYSADGTRQLELQSGNRSTYTNGTFLSANTYHKVAAVGVSNGAHLFQVSWDGAYNTSNNNIIWETCGAAVHGMASATNAFNGTVRELIDFKYTYHHRSIATPYFYIDSDNSSGAYGVMSIYVYPTQEMKFVSFKFHSKRLTTKLG